jgi:hypothetical protein
VIGLLAHLGRFAGLLRARGILVGVGDEVDAARALTLIDLLDHDEVRRALRSAFKIRRRQWDDFDQAFDEAWMGAARRVEARRAVPRQQAALAARRVISEAPFDRTTSVPDSGDAAGDRPGYSPDALLRRKPFDQCSEDDLDQMVRLLDRLAPRLATRRSRRLVPTASRGRVDLRRSPRRALATGGELVSLARRARAIEEPRLVVLCDTSGSMDVHARFLLTFALALRRSVRRTEVFAFNTALTRLTPWFAPGSAAATLERVAHAVPDWSGGTRIGESLSAFVSTWLDQLVNRATVIVIFSDGLDRGDTASIADAMRAIRARARRVVWLNPLGGDPRYEPTARAMQIAMPFVDRLAPAHNLESLEQILSELTV